MATPIKAIISINGKTGARQEVRRIPKRNNKYVLTKGGNTLADDNKEVDSLEEVMAYLAAGYLVRSSGSLRDLAAVTPIY